DAWKPGAVQPRTVEVPVQASGAVESPQLSATLKVQADYVRQVAWAPDGKTLATLSEERGKVQLWDVAARKELRTLKTDLGESHSLAFTPDSKTLAVGYFQHESKTSLTGGIVLWDVATGRRRALLRHTPPRGVSRFALSPDGKTIAAAEIWKEGEEGKPRRCLTLWDIGRGTVQASLPEENVSALAFSPDGKVLARSAFVMKDDEVTAIEVRRRDLMKAQELSV